MVADTTPKLRWHHELITSLEATQNKQSWKYWYVVRNLCFPHFHGFMYVGRNAWERTCAKDDELQLLDPMAGKGRNGCKAYQRPLEGIGLCSSHSQSMLASRHHGLSQGLQLQGIPWLQSRVHFIFVLLYGNTNMRKTSMTSKTFYNWVWVHLAILHMKPPPFGEFFMCKDQSRHR